MARGRKKKPTGLHIAEGTFRSDRHGDPAEEIQTDGEPIPDDDLPPMGKKLWDQIVPLLVSQNVVGVLDSANLNLLCRQYAKGMAWDKKILSRKRLDKNMMRDERISSMIWNDFNRVAARFGLSPSDRASLRIEKPKPTGIPKRNRKAR